MRVIPRRFERPIKGRQRAQAASVAGATGFWLEQLSFTC
jgi:hypothetical protein